MAIEFLWRTGLRVILRPIFFQIKKLFTQQLKNYFVHIFFVKGVDFFSFFLFFFSSSETKKYYLIAVSTKANSDKYG